MKKLTPKQARFVEEYLVDLNATRAAIRAGYRQKAARQQAARMLTNVNVEAAITAAQTERSRRVEVSQDWVLERLKAEAEDRGDDASHGSRIRALELLGRHIGMWSNKVQAEGGATLVIAEIIVSTREEAQQALQLVEEAKERELQPS